MPWDAPQQWGADLRGLYADLAALRTEHRALVDGSLRFIHAEGDLLVYVREHARGSVLCVISRGPVAETSLGTGIRLEGDPAEPLMQAGTAPRLHVNAAGEVLVGARGAGAVFHLVPAPMPWS